MRSAPFPASYLCDLSQLLASLLWKLVLTWLCDASQVLGEERSWEGTVGKESSTRGNLPKPLSDIGIFRLHKRWSFSQMCFPHFYKDNAEGVSCVLPLRGFYRWKVLWFKAHWSDLTDLSPGLRRSFLCFSTSVRSCPLAGHTHLGTDYLYICYVWGPDWLTTFHLPSSPQK